MCSNPARPPLDGSIPILPGFIDFHAQHNPEQPWALLSAGPGLPVEAISFAEFARATNRVAHRLRPNRSGPDNEVIAILISCDTVLYLAMLAGTMRAGIVPFPMSPRNSAPAIVDMLKRTSCRRIVGQASMHSLLADVQSELENEEHTLQIDFLPELEEIFPTLRGGSSADLCEPYPSSNKLFSMDDVVFYLHSSGSTGFPKPIPQRQSDILHTCNASIITDSMNREVIWGGMALPTFHLMGICVQLYYPLVSGLSVCLFAPRAPASPVVPTPRNTIEAAMAAKCTGILTVPAFVEAWARLKGDVEYLKTLKIVVFGGGPLPSKVGDELIVEGVNLYPWYGGTEFGPHTRVFDMDESSNPAPNGKTRADWEWLSFSDRVTCRWVSEGDSTFELQLLTCATHRPNVENLEDTRGYATNDLWKPHPSKEGLWRIIGRKDDVIVLSLGEKVVPIPQEGVISSSRIVQGAVMFGRGKSQCGVLVEPRKGHAISLNDVNALLKFRNKLWPVVEEANRTAPAFARIFKEMIIVTDRARPLPRTAKGTVVRKQALKAYEKEIDSLYAILEDSGNAESIRPPSSWSVPDIQAWLQEHASALANRSDVISPSRDLFGQGFDSLNATFLRTRIINALRADPQTRIFALHVSQTFVFEHPTLHDLAIAIGVLVGEDVREDVRN
ncbi:uncharacterized protein PHACADRAFT_153008 [Phanerochaete carnosa HHB-10118-sp]|uniref:Carrier domain-containing protein n=1 Tax=Phanerochaete carnosa (strain HHB-10118-sp) TaxID=650164 RepID=K5VHN2_PHACS|nr:uncharacterized protein PHACADRAFT_153008 [Phanerochaete carnosa HHB-10118-sp]EKM50758.1 hypothetical protein PHACADRAFT_153008 [Phanerochaete carnosa HHB-10118-sp]